MASGVKKVDHDLTHGVLAEVTDYIEAAFEHAGEISPEEKIQTLQMLMHWCEVEIMSLKDHIEDRQ